MKSKFSVKLSRVKGASFHPSRPWILVSLHSGLVQIWDYKIGTQVAKFDEHEGPVRTANFHHALPLFVTGGDDSLVKVWNYKQRKCLFTLKGHIDYIRTAVFHKQLPWILSACDDQTMRIWNYQSRNCINIITGHTHYVMCAQFHDDKNLIVSCSLDATVRVWDFSVLKKRLTESKDLTSFVGIEIQCIKVLEGHERGVNWVAFHPSLNFIASCSDDRKIKLWKYTLEVAWQHSVLPGHNHNVSCVIFDKTGRLFSNSEDKTVRIWNIDTKQVTDTYKKSRERHWILALNEAQNLLVSGHDEGFDILSISNEKIPYTLLDHQILIVAQRMDLLMIYYEKGTETKQLQQYIPRNKDASVKIKKIFSNPFNNSLYVILVRQDRTNRFFVKKKENHLMFPKVVKSFQALDACFVSDSCMALLLNQNQIEFEYIQNPSGKKKCMKLNLKIERIFSFQPNVILLATKNLIAKFQFEAGKMVDSFDFEQELTIKQVVKGKNTALLSKYKIIVLDEEFSKACEIKEQFPITSAFWERQNLLFYTTSNHWKYSLINGQTGILKSIDEPLHLIKKIGSHEYLAFSQRKRVFKIQCPKYDELEFKLALLQKEWDLVKQFVKDMPRRGKGLIGYLVGKDYSSIALDLVSDKKQKFALSINSSQFQLAYDLCNQQNNPQMWQILSEQALKQGVYNVVEVTYQKLQKYQNMSMMYVLQGNQEKLSKMLKLSQKMKDPTSIFNNSLWLNEPKERVQLLNEFGYNKLAQLASAAHKLSSNPQFDNLLRKLGSAPLNYCKPVTKDFSNWPHNQIEDEYLLSKQG